MVVLTHQGCKEIWRKEKTRYESVSAKLIFQWTESSILHSKLHAPYTGNSVHNIHHKKSKKKALEVEAAKCDPYMFENFFSTPQVCFCQGTSETGVGGIMVPSMNCLWSPVWRLSACLESDVIFNIHFIMQYPSKKLLKLKLGNSKVPQTTS